MTKYGRKVLSVTPLIKDDKIFHSFLRFAKYDVMAAIFKAILSNLIFHYNPYITSKRVTSFAGPIFVSLHLSNTARF